MLAVCQARTYGHVLRKPCECQLLGRCRRGSLGRVFCLVVRVMWELKGLTAAVIGEGWCVGLLPSMNPLPALTASCLGASPTTVVHGVTRRPQSDVCVRCVSCHAGQDRC